VKEDIIVGLKGGKMFLAKLVAFKVWKCKFCDETRQDSEDMARHLGETHNIHFLESFGGRMYEIDAKIKPVIPEK
jgi:hypothetical protein